MFDIIIKLIIASIDLSNGKRYILSLDKDDFNLPEFIVTRDFDIEDTINKKLYELTGFNANIFKPTIKKVSIKNNKLCLYYLTKIPYNTTIDGHWIEDIVACSLENEISACIIYV